MASIPGEVSCKALVAEEEEEEEPRGKVWLELLTDEV